MWLHFIILCIKLYLIHIYQGVLCILYRNLLEKYKVIINDYSCGIFWVIYVRVFFAYWEQSENLW